MAQAEAAAVTEAVAVKGPEAAGWVQGWTGLVMAGAGLEAVAAVAAEARTAVGWVQG